MSKIVVLSFKGANFSELVGPNKTINGILDMLNICIIPLSIETAFSNLSPKAVTKAGQEISVSNSGIIEFGTSVFNFSNYLMLVFSMKKTGILFFFKILLAKIIKLLIG